MFNFKTLIATLLLSSIASWSFAQAAPERARTSPEAPAVVSATAQAGAKPKLHKVKHQAKKKHKARQHAVKAGANQTVGKSRSKGPGLEAY
jgi:hypothetical protein